MTCYLNAKCFLEKRLFRRIDFCTVGFGEQLLSLKWNVMGIASRDKQTILYISELATINITFYSIPRKFTTQCQSIQSA